MDRHALIAGDRSKPSALSPGVACAVAHHSPDEPMGWKDGHRSRHTDDRDVLRRIPCYRELPTWLSSGMGAANDQTELMVCLRSIPNISDHS